MHDGVLADAHPVADDRRIDVMRDVHGRARGPSQKSSPTLHEMSVGADHRGCAELRIASDRSAAEDGCPLAGYRGAGELRERPRVWKHEQHRGMTRYRDTRRLVELVAGHSHSLRTVEGLSSGIDRGLFECPDGEPAKPLRCGTTRPGWNIARQTRVRAMDG